MQRLNHISFIFQVRQGTARDARTLQGTVHNDVYSEDLLFLYEPYTVRYTARYTVRTCYPVNAMQCVWGRVALI